MQRSARGEHHIMVCGGVAGVVRWPTLLHPPPESGVVVGSIAFVGEGHLNIAVDSNRSQVLRKEGT
eukprot:11169216-Lingulodinium_polyedra.AAC.1